MLWTLSFKLTMRRRPFYIFPLGVAIGMAIGVALKSMAIGAGIGVALGIAMSTIYERTGKKDQ